MKKIKLDDLDHILDEIGEIPTLPSIATAIMERTLEENVNARQIADLIEKDQALALKVLKVANSPFYRRIKEISTIRGAVVLLGLNVLKSIVLSISVIDLFDKKKKKALDMYEFWQHSIACAVCARDIASRGFPALAEDAFVAGLLHDLGKIVADQIICSEGEYEQVIKAVNKGRDLIEEEKNLMGIDHATLGKLLAEKWNLPSILTRSIEMHHTVIGDNFNDPQEKRLCTIVHVANMITNHLGLGIVPSHTGFIEPQLLKQLDLSSHDVQEISIALKDSIAMISEQLGIPQAEPKTYFEVLQTANAQLGRISMDLEQKKSALEQRTQELSSINQMSSALQASMKLSDITKVITSHSLTIMNARKARCLIRLSQLRIMITESFMVDDQIQTRTGVAGATKELLDLTNGIFPRNGKTIQVPIKVDNKCIGAIELVDLEENEHVDLNQKRLLLHTIGEIGNQAIQRAMLITRNIKSQRLAAVSKTAIAANHEINSPLTTVLLKLDMLLGGRDIPEKALTDLKGIKKEALKIQSLVKKMLEISDVVETNYAHNEKMLDLKRATEKPQTPPPENDSTEAPGFEDYLDD